MQQKKKDSKQKHSAANAAPTKRACDCVRAGLEICRDGVHSDVLGSYPGVSEVDEQPIQDADDL